MVRNLFCQSVQFFGTVWQIVFGPVEPVTWLGSPWYRSCSATLSLCFPSLLVRWFGGLWCQGVVRWR